MDFFSILTLIGGLALFLYGMNAMGDGLAKVSGGKLEKILENLTSSPIKAVLLGAGVTAVIQSSSATTVMVVGFVNSGIMKLSQAVGVIMGANIGTTVTSWILSLTGIQSDNFIIRMFKPTSFSPILAIIGVIFILFISDPVIFCICRYSAGTLSHWCSAVQCSNPDHHGTEHRHLYHSDPFCNRCEKECQTCSSSTSLL